MNDAGREVLVQAALNGHKQYRGLYHAFHKEADCALGVLHLTMHSSRGEAIECASACNNESIKCQLDMRQKYEIEDDEQHTIVDLNDKKRVGFLEIARKVGVKEESI